jgi:hypothetical protein
MTETINRNKAKELIRATEGKIFSSTFIKKNSEVRTLTGRLQVTKHLKENAKPAPYNPENYNLQCVYDMKAKGYRMINLQTLTNLTINNIKYLIK